MYKNNCRLILFRNSKRYHMICSKMVSVCQEYNVKLRHETTKKIYIYMIFIQNDRTDNLCQLKVYRDIQELATKLTKTNSKHLDSKFMPSNWNATTFRKRFNHDRLNEKRKIIQPEKYRKSKTYSSVYIQWLYISMTYL